MPRNGSGVYSAPPNTLATTLTTIKSPEYNAFVNDLVTDANATRPVVAGGTGATSVVAAQTSLSIDNKVVYASKNAGYAALATDNNAVHRYTATATVALAAAATLGANWHYTVIADGGDVTIDPNASETINGVATLVVENGGVATIICDGSAFFASVAQKPVATTVDNQVPRWDGTRGKLQGGSGMTIDDSGNVDITGRFKAGDAGFVSDAQLEARATSGFAAGFELTAASSGSCVGTNRTSSDGSHVIFYRGGNQAGSISNTSTTVAYNTSSDYRIKDDVLPLDRGLEAILQLIPSTFIMKFDETRQRRTGFIAHEVQAVFPEAVTGEKDAVDENGEIIVQQLDPAKLIPLLVKGIQQLAAKVEALEAVQFSA